MAKKPHKKALIISQAVDLTLALPNLLTQAGFEVDCISTKKILKQDRQIHKFYLAENPADLIEKSSGVLHHQYDLIIPADDLSINLILKSDLPAEMKLALLPVTDQKFFSHLTSKIGLSLILQTSNIPTPEFAVINSKKELEDAALKMGFPLMLKGDFSGAGAETFECLCDEDLQKILIDFTHYPAILQRKITGDLVAIEAFYKDGKLIHYSYSTVVENLNASPFGVSVLRNYMQAAAAGKTVFDELTSIGKALGADGFANISCIRTHPDNKRYYFEADMRPTAWAYHSKYIGEPLTENIRNYFDCGQIANYTGIVNKNYPEQLIIPLFIRMKLWELIINRYSVWKYRPDKSIISRIHIRRIKLKILGLLTLKPLRKKYQQKTPETN